jgi:hypothetical protein
MHYFSHLSIVFSASCQLTLLLAQFQDSDQGYPINQTQMVKYNFLSSVTFTFLVLYSTGYSFHLTFKYLFPGLLQKGSIITSPVFSCTQNFHIHEVRQLFCNRCLNIFLPLFHQFSY